MNDEARKHAGGKMKSGFRAQSYHMLGGGFFIGVRPLTLSTPSIRLSLQPSVYHFNPVPSDKVRFEV